MNYLPKIRSLIDKEQRWKLYLMLGVGVYFVGMNQILHVRPDHIFLALFMLSFVLGKQKAKRFVADWLPFCGFWILYDMMRGVVDGWRMEGNIRNVFDVELAIFGRFFDDMIPSFWFQQFHYTYEGELWKGAMDLIGANLYGFHFGVPLFLGWILWHTANDRVMYYRYVWTLTVLNVMALITFFVFPAAGPWYVMQYGFEQPVGHLIGTAGSLVNFDRIVQLNFFTTLWDNFSPNQFAAIPSLHGAYPMVLSLFAYIKWRKKPILLAMYPLLVWWAAVYLNLHYIIDLIISVPYVWIAYIVANKFLVPKVFGPWFLNKHPRIIETGQQAG